HGRQRDLATRASYERELQELRAEVRGGLDRWSRTSAVVPAATIGKTSRRDELGEGGTPAARARIVAEIKKELESEMGLLPVQLLRDRRSSFVELYSYDNLGK